MQNVLPLDGSLEGISSLLEGTEYRPRRFLGRGGIGLVFEVEHTFIGRSFALKVLQPNLAADSTFADRMRVEAQVLGRLNHPNAVEVVDFWVTTHGRPCLLMELLSGRTLAEELLRRQRLPTAEAVSFAIQALSALAAAHALGVVHRDIKPENLFLHEAPGCGRRLKVLDFGLARVTNEAAPRGPSKPAQSTATGAFVGTPRFMSPEAARGEKVDGRADVFSLGLVLYAALVGHGPFDYDATRPAPPSAQGAETVAALDEVLLRALRERPEERFQRAEDFLNALTPFAAGLEPRTKPARPPSS